MRLADLACAYHLIDRAMVVIEAAAETDLQPHARRLCRVDCLMHTRNVIVYRLLTEDMLARLCRLNDVLRVRVRRGRDDDRLDLRIVQDVRRILRDILDAVLLRVRRRLLVCKRIRDHLDLHGGNKECNIPDMNLADAPRADDADLHGESPFLCLVICCSAFWFYYRGCEHKCNFPIF